jgi:diguanylate cyclase (GGDEF)-like protein
MPWGAPVSSSGKNVFPSELLGLGADSYLGSGAVLWREGDPGGDVALVLDGTLEVYREADEGDVVLDSVEVGQVVGEIALDGGARTAAVRAKTAAHVLRVGASEFRRLLRERADLVESLYWTQVNRLRRIVRQTETHPRRVIEVHTRTCSYPFFVERLDQEHRRAREAGDELSVVLCELDGLAAFREAAGDKAADSCLADLAATLRAGAGRGDVVARYGQSQLAVILYGAGGGAARELAESFRAAAAVRPSPVAMGSTATLSASVASFPADAADPAALLRAADVALYKAKEAGGNRVVSAG